MVKDMIEGLQYRDDLDFTWFTKLQLLLKPNESILFGGNVFHSIHGNFTKMNRLSGWWVFEIINTKIQSEYEINTELVNIDWSKYKLDDFDPGWITKRSEYISWCNKTSTKEIKINWKKQWQFKTTTVFDTNKLSLSSSSSSSSLLLLTNDINNISNIILNKLQKHFKETRGQEIQKDDLFKMLNEEELQIIKTENKLNEILLNLHNENEIFYIERTSAINEWQ